MDIDLRTLVDTHYFVLVEVGSSNTAVLYIYAPVQQRRKSPYYAAFNLVLCTGRVYHHAAVYCTGNAIHGHFFIGYSNQGHYGAIGVAVRVDGDPSSLSGGKRLPP